MACTITNPVGCITSAASSVAGDAFSSIAHDFARAADSTIKWLWTEIGTSTSIHLGGKAFDLDLAIVATITGVVAVGLFVIQVIGSALRRDPGGLSRAFRGLVIAFIAGGAAVAITNLSLSAIDSLSAGVVQAAAGTDMGGMGARVLSSGALLTVSNPAAMFLLSIATIAAVLIVWFALTVRKVLIVVSAVFAPLAFAGSLADITASWTRRWIEVMAALIVSKLLLVLIFIVGWGVLDGAGQNGAGSAQQMTQLVSGLLILGVAGLAPWMALKMIHFSGEQFHHLHGLAMAGTAGAQRASAAPQKAAAWTSRIASGPVGAAAMGPNLSTPSGHSGPSGPVGHSGATPGSDMTPSLLGSRSSAGPGGSWPQGQTVWAAAPNLNPEASASSTPGPLPPLGPRPGG